MNAEKNVCGDFERAASLAAAEDLVEKKAKIYSRLLTDMSLSEDMTAIAARCEGRKEMLEKLAGGGK